MEDVAHRRGTGRDALGGLAEAAAAVLAASLVVAALDRVAPATGLEVVFLPAVLLVAIRRGQVLALVTAVASVLVLNFFFIPPVHRLTIADSRDLAALVVLLVVAVVVGRLAADARRRAAEADARAREAADRERESALVAEAAEAVLAGGGVPSRLRSVAASVARATGAAEARIALEPAAAPHPGERALRLPLADRTGWLYLGGEPAWDPDAVARLAVPLARLLDVALARERLAEREAEAEAARRAEVARTAVLHAISHDLRSPLTGITTAVAALRDPGLGDEDRRELVAVVDEEAARLAGLVDDLLDLSRIQAGAADPREDWCDLADVAAGAAEQVRRAHGEHPIEIDLPPDLPLVRADPAQLERALANLIDNAVKFSPPHEPVRVTGGTGGGRVTVRVTDRGRGIARDQRRQVFEPFFRGRGAAGGSGLGLAIVRGFVEANGGRVVVSSPPGEGTSFAVSFPAVPQPAPAP